MGWMGAAMGWMGALGMHEAFNACYAGARGASRALRRAHAFLIPSRMVRTGPVHKYRPVSGYLRQGTDSWQNNFSVIIGFECQEVRRILTVLLLFNTTRAHTPDPQARV